MASILKDQNNRIWKDPSGRILKSAPFNQQVLQNGLSFWGVADSNFMTLVSGKVSELYDFRDPSKTGATYGKMVQATDANRPLFSNGLMTLENQNMTHSSQSSFTTLFLVSKLSRGVEGHTTYNSGLGTTNVNTGLMTDASGFPKYQDYKDYSTSYYFYANNSKVMTVSIPSNYFIQHSLDSFSKSGITISLRGVQGKMTVLEFGWYNRILSEQEVVYNVNALNAKYSIF